ncbi:MAG: hypothetical protein AAFR59_12605 [Bacteroidota bacterium]
MRTYIKLFLAAVFLCYGSIDGAQAQTRSQEKVEKVYRQSFAFGMISSNRGYGLQAVYLRGIGNRQLYIGVDTRFVRSLFETKINPIYSNDLRYVFGKRNYFFTVRPEVGFSYNFIPQSALNLLDIKVGFALSPVLGFTTPYYIQICDGNTSQVCSAVPFDPSIHTYQSIAGRAPFFSGEFSPKFHPGIGGKLFATIDIGGGESFISAIRFETTTDLFLQDIPIMMESENLSNQQIFLSFNVSFLMGGKW